VKQIKCLHEANHRARVGISDQQHDGYMKREDIIAFGKKKYGEPWIASLAEDIGYSVSSVMRVANGETPVVSRRMELEMERLMREERIRYMNLHAVDMRY